MKNRGSSNVHRWSPGPKGWPRHASASFRRRSFLRSSRRTTTSHSWPSRRLRVYRTRRCQPFQSKEKVGAAAAELLSHETTGGAGQGHGRQREQRGRRAGCRIRTVRRRQRPLGHVVQRLGSLAPLLEEARVGHQAWLQRIFSDSLPKTAAARSPRFTPCTRPPTSTHGSSCVAIFRLTRADTPADHDCPGQRHSEEQSGRATPFAISIGAHDRGTAVTCLLSLTAGGNVPPELSAARRLVERGHAVTVLAEDSVALDVQATGAALRRWVRAPNRPSAAGA